MKRLFDILLALVVLPLAIPILLCAAIAIRLDSPGSPLFFQRRVGKGRHEFSMLKLRTMRIGTISAGSHQVGSASITRVGQILRRTKIDELPQLLSVLSGQMSFVGPRPCLPNQDELIRERDRIGVFSVRPGITGRAQVAGIDMSEPARLAKIDAEYITHRSFAGDLRLILATALGRGSGDAASLPPR